MSDADMALAKVLALLLIPTLLLGAAVAVLAILVFG
jgi:hypothetical protein